MIDQLEEFKGLLQKEEELTAEEIGHLVEIGNQLNETGEGLPNWVGAVVNATNIEGAIEVAKEALAYDLREKRGDEQHEVVE